MRLFKVLVPRIHSSGGPAPVALPPHQDPSARGRDDASSKWEVKRSGNAAGLQFEPCATMYVKPSRRDPRSSDTVPETCTCHLVVSSKLTGRSETGFFFPDKPHGAHRFSQNCRGEIRMPSEACSRLDSLQIAAGGTLVLQPRICPEKSAQPESGSRWI